MNSVVFRGIPDQGGSNFTDILKDLRSWYSGEVVLSTWQGVELSEEVRSMLDTVLELQDPGTLEDVANPSIVQLKRQIYAAREGVRIASGDKVLLTRTDISHKQNLFNLVQENHSGSNYKVFSGRVIASSIMTIDPDSGYGPARDRFFRVCDWFQCGFKEDIVKFTDVLEESQVHKKSGCCMEQLWFLSCFNKFTGYNFHINSIEQHMDCCLEVMVQNFRLINTTGFNAGKWKSKTIESIYLSPEKCELLYLRSI